MLPEGRNLLNVERLRPAIERNHSRWPRFQHYNSKNAQSYYSPINYAQGLYYMQMAIGSPVPLKLHFMLDTGSDLIWTRCQPCADSCESDPQNDPIYNPFESSSYNNVVSCSSNFCKALNVSWTSGTRNFQRNCNYKIAYGGGTSGVLGAETFSLAAASSTKWTSFPHLTFGCGHQTLHMSGIVGLGKGPLSLVSRIGSCFDNIFSYCLGSMYDSSQVSPLFLGRADTFGVGYGVAPLIQNPVQRHVFRSSYYLGLDGISVVGKPVPIPNGAFKIIANGSEGLVIDSGTIVTLLEADGYTPFRNAVRASITAQPVINAYALTTFGFDLCYIFKPGLVFPNITFHFAGGADYVLPPDNSFISEQGYTDGLVCLAFINSTYPFSIFGNFQQQNFHIIYDAGQNELSFAHANCAADDTSSDYLTNFQ